MSTDLDIVFQHAVSLHHSGKLAEAAVLYRKLLRQLPSNPQVLQALGLVELQSGNTEEGVNLLGRSLRIDPDQPRALCNRGLGLQQLGRLDEALTCLEHAVALQPSFVEAHVNRGNVLLDMGRLNDAVASFDQAVALKPGVALTHFNKGNALQKLKRFEEAFACYGDAIACDAKYAEAYVNRGSTLRDLKRFEEALADYDRAIALNANRAQWHYNRGVVLQDLERFNEALTAYDRALAIEPNISEAWNNRGDVLERLDRFDDALVSYDRAIALNPSYTNAYNNRGNALKALKRLADASISYDQATVIDPDCAEAYWNKSILKLLNGELADGWGLYEWRRKCSHHQARSFSQPEWTGELPIAGRTMLVHPEQGYGDFIQFCRYIPKLRALGAKVVVESPKRLLPLLSTLRADVSLVEMGQPMPYFDLQCPIMSLPWAFKTDLSNVPADVPYLFADPQKVKDISERLGQKLRPRIGLVWSGNPGHRDDHRRSVPLSAMAALLQLPFDFHCLQKEFRPDDAATLERLPQIKLHADDQSDFSDAAALVQVMDLVITVDTVVAHIAGALGKPVWLLLPWVPDWRWLLERNDSPWYPTATLFRQPTMGDWRSVIDEIFDRLQSELRNPSLASGFRPIDALWVS